MSLPAAAARDRLGDLVAAQHGAVARRQLLALGLSAGVIRARLAAGRRRRIHPGVYLTFTGPIPQLTRVWAAVLYAGRGAVASHQSAAWLAGVADDPPPDVHLSVPRTRRVAAQPGLRIHLCARLDGAAHPVLSPPQTRIEETILDLVHDAARAEDVIDLLTRACQWRALVRDVLADINAGVHSPLERRWARDVERAHGLAPGERNLPEGTATARRYHDVRYRGLRVVVELDGRAAHPAEALPRDQARDNEVAEAGGITLRYGWRAVAGSPCQCAAQVARVLRRRGWTGTARRCGPDCAVATPPA